MNRRIAVFGLLAIGVMAAAAVVFLSGRSNEYAAAVPPGETLDVPCSSCDARHQRLGKERSGKD